MSDNSSNDMDDHAQSSPTNQHGGIDAQTLRDLVQTEQGAATLAEALKDRRVRDVLKKHGVKVQTDEDVGYNSLPLEIRDRIRACTIAVVKPVRAFPVPKCLICPRLAPLACIDSEWRSAVESTTFESLTLKGGDRDGILRELEHFECYVVGNRRKYLHHICLPAQGASGFIPHETAEDEEEWQQKWIDAFVLPTRRLFKYVEQWDERGVYNGDLGVEIQTVLWNGNISMPPHVCARLNGLPTIPQIRHFYATLWEPMDIDSILAILSAMPNLQSATIVLGASRYPEDEAESEIQRFFHALPDIVPKLETLKVKCKASWGLGDLPAMFWTEALRYSQKLRRFSLLPQPICRASQLLSVLEPFSALRFDPDAPPPLIWPNLTDFNIENWYVNDILEERKEIDQVLNIGDLLTAVLNELMATFGRIVRCMPRIRNLEIGLTYRRGLDPQGWVNPHGQIDVVLNLETMRWPTGNCPRAVLSVTHNNFCDYPPETVPSEEVIALWRESLLHSANAVLEVQVISTGSGLQL